MRGSRASRARIASLVWPCSSSISTYRFLRQKRNEVRTHLSWDRDAPIPRAVGRVSSFKTQVVT
jgi:hypothetical protein